MLQSTKKLLVDTSSARFRSVDVASGSLTGQGVIKQELATIFSYGTLTITKEIKMFINHNQPKARVLEQLYKDP